MSQRMTRGRIVEFIVGLTQAESATTDAARRAALDRVADVSQYLTGRLDAWEHLFTAEEVKTELAPARKMLDLYVGEPERALDHPRGCALGEECDLPPDETAPPVGFTVARLWVDLAERADEAQRRRSTRAVVNGFSIALTIVSATAAGVIAWRGRYR